MIVRPMGQGQLRKGHLVVVGLGLGDDIMLIVARCKFVELDLAGRACVFFRLVASTSRGFCRAVISKEE